MDDIKDEEDDKDDGDDGEEEEGKSNHPEVKSEGGFFVLIPTEVPFIVGSQLLSIVVIIYLVLITISTITIITGATIIAIMIFTFMINPFHYFSPGPLRQYSR